MFFDFEIGLSLGGGHDKKVVSQKYLMKNYLAHL
jgi:hypothetical protein